MNTKVHFSSKTDQWATPQPFFDKLNEEFGFTLDVCAESQNAKCKRFITPETDGLQVGWDKEIVWMNPPYGREIGKWVKKASDARGGWSFVYCPLEQIQNIFTNIFTKILGQKSDLLKVALNSGMLKILPLSRVWS